MNISFRKICVHRGWIAFCLASVLLGCGRPPRGPKVSPTAEIAPTSTSVVTTTSSPINFAASDWPQWRGPTSDGIATGPAIPTEWSATKNITWKAEIPGRGHASPIVIGHKVLVETATTGSAGAQGVLCLDRATGKPLWSKELHQGKQETAMHQENTQASSTLAYDGERLIALFLNDRRIWATALDLEGNQLWQTEIGPFASKFGYSASPVLHQSLAIVAADHQDGGFMAALDRATGKIIWRKSRPSKSSYASPRVITLNGKYQLILAGCKLVVSYNPLTGDKLWETAGTAESAVGTPVVSGGLILASGGYPEQDTVALNSDGTVAWRQKIKSYVPSMLTHDGALYLVADDGIARCHNALTGKELWKQRLGGNFRASPVLCGQNILITDMAGKTTLFAASKEKFTQVAQNQLGSEAFASPAISQGQIFLRVGAGSGRDKKDLLYCVGERISVEKEASAAP